MIISREMKCNTHFTFQEGTGLQHQMCNLYLSVKTAHIFYYTYSQQPQPQESPLNDGFDWNAFHVVEVSEENRSILSKIFAG